MILATVSSQAEFHTGVTASVYGRIKFEGTWALHYGMAPRIQAFGSDQPCIAVLDFTEPSKAMAVVNSLGRLGHVSVIAVGCGNSCEELRQLMQSGVRDVLPEFRNDELRDAIERARVSLGAQAIPLGDLCAFVPAKPGCGATTVATHATAVAARMALEPMLLLDYDIRLGMTSFLLKAEGNYTVVDALLQADRLDQDLWSSLVSQLGNLHLLGSGPVDFSRSFGHEPFAHLLDFAVRRYPAVSVDLPGTMEQHECEVLLRSKEIFLVCTPDIGALHVARRKAAWFQQQGLMDKVSVVMNCMERRNSLSVRDLEQIIQMPVRHLLPVASAEIAKASQKGSILEGSSPLAKQIAAIASRMVPEPKTMTKMNPVRRFVEYFSISAAREASTLRIR